MLTGWVTPGLPRTGKFYNHEVYISLYFLWHIVVLHFFFGVSIFLKPIFLQTKGRKKSKSPIKSLGGSERTDKIPSTRPCCVVTPISPSVPANLLHDNLDDVTATAESNLYDAAVTDKDIQDELPTPVSSFSSLDSDETQAISSESESSVSSKSNSGSAKENRQLLTSKKTLSENEFQNLLCSPVVRPLDEDERMRRAGNAHGSPVPDIVQEYGSSIVSSSYDRIYGGYHDIVPPLQPYTRPVIFQSPLSGKFSKR